ncbi:MAG: T9SS type A sorting domain-containing protein [Schleiferiaceae bacterium]|jgi:protocatechuate 3,4-dioxygenase beta subunit|nr:T9SS type A sorting domain-containing protein [Schleiferiaceae bacterium]
MEEQEKNNTRRHFLRNTAFASLGLGVLPRIGNAAELQKEEQTASCNPTTLDYYGQGPFYTANAPTMINNQLALPNEPGTRLIISGIVQTLDCTNVIPNTVIDVWHADDAGTYDNTGFNLRGITQSNAQGFYTFETILPGKYLNGSMYRPSHIHFKITPPGFPTLITQLYFQGDTDIPADAAASLTSGTYDATHRIIPIAMNTQGRYEGTWDIAIDGAGNIGMSELHTEKGIIYTVSPNPFTEEIKINYGIFQPAEVNIQIFNMQGSIVAVLDEKNLAPEKYEAIWKPEQHIPAGTYFVALKLNDLQVHYQKIIKQ